MENKQTAVEWLQEAIQIHLTHEQKMSFEGLFQQALQMEKMQSIEADNRGLIGGLQVAKQRKTDANGDWYDQSYQ